MTSASTWFENTSQDTFFDHRNKQRLQLDHFIISQNPRNKLPIVKGHGQSSAVTIFQLRSNRE
eukprot:524945-Ditylum_brightwellii.AAC.1